MTERRECYVPIPPQPKQRARRDPRSDRFYTPTKTKEAEAAVAAAWGARYREPWPAGVPLKLWVEGVFARPAGVAPDAVFVVTVPDWDNLGKIVSDGLNGVAYVDDRQIADGRALKRYCMGEEQPHIYIIMEPLPDPQKLAVLAMLANGERAIPYRRTERRPA